MVQEYCVWVRQKCILIETCDIVTTIMSCPWRTLRSCDVCTGEVSSGEGIFLPISPTILWIIYLLGTRLVQLEST